MENDKKKKKKVKINHSKFFRQGEAVTIAVSNTAIGAGYFYASRLMVLSVTKQLADGDG